MPLENIIGDQHPAEGTKSDPRNVAEYFKESLGDIPKEFSKEVQDDFIVGNVDRISHGIHNALFSARDYFDDDNRVANYLFGGKPTIDELQQSAYEYPKFLDYFGDQVSRGYGELKERLFTYDDFVNVYDSLAGTYNNEPKIPATVLSEKYPFINWTKALPISAVNRRVKLFKENKSFLFRESNDPGYESTFSEVVGGFLGGAGATLTDPVSIGIGLATYGLTRNVGIGTGAIFIASNVLANNVLYTVSEKSLISFGDFVQGSESEDITIGGISSEIIFGTLFHGIFAGVGKLYKGRKGGGSVPPPPPDGGLAPKVKEVLPPDAPGGNEVSGKVGVFLDEAVDDTRAYAGNLLDNEQPESILKGVAQASKNIINSDSADSVSKSLRNKYNGFLEKFLKAKDTPAVKSEVVDDLAEFNRINDVDDANKISFNQEVDNFNSAPALVDPADEIEDALTKIYQKGLAERFGNFSKAIKTFDIKSVTSKIKEVVSCKIK